MKGTQKPISIEHKHVCNITWAACDEEEEKKEEKKSGNGKSITTRQGIYIYMCVDLSYPDLCTHQYNSARNGSS